MNNRPLTPHETAIIIRFEAWLKKLFGTVAWPLGTQRPFSAKTNRDQQGNLLINHGRMLLQQPCDEVAAYRITHLESGWQVVEPSLERALLAALTQAIRVHFVMHFEPQ